jgi:hypothetical protein
LEDEISLATASTSDNEQTFDLALTWIYNCLENHTYCNRSLPLPQNRILPGRLIDVGDRPTVAPRLCVTSDFPVETNYIDTLPFLGKPLATQAHYFDS